MTHPLTERRGGLVGALFHKQTYRNIIYLLLALPLGITYFVFLVAGLSLGLGLLVVGLGLPILLLVLLASWGLASFERDLAIDMLDAGIPPLPRPAFREKSIRRRITACLRNPATWKSLLYLFVRFPLGVVSFVVAVTLLALTGGLVAAPFIYRDVPVSIGLPFADIPLLKVETFGEALGCAMIGLAIGLVSLHLLNLLASVHRRIARIALSEDRRE